MSLDDIIASYIAQQRSLGKRFLSETTILAAFKKAASDVPLRDIGPEFIASFVNRGGTSDETKRKKYRVVAGLFRFAVTRRILNASPIPRPSRMRCCSSYTPYIYSRAELKRLLAAVPMATASPGSVIDADTLRTFVLLLYGAALRRGEALRLKLEDVDVAQSLIHIRGTKFFKTRIVPLSTNLNSLIGAFVARRGKCHPGCGQSPRFSSRDGMPLRNTTIGTAFRRLCAIAGVRREGGSRNQPRMHDLRHNSASQIIPSAAAVLR